MTEAIGPLEEAVRSSLDRFPGKRTKPRITSAMVAEAAQIIMREPANHPELERVRIVLTDILKLAGRAPLVEELLALAMELSMDEDCEKAFDEIVYDLVEADIETIMSA